MSTDPTAEQSIPLSTVRLTPRQMEFLRLMLEDGTPPTDAYRMAYNDKADRRVSSNKAGRLRKHPVIARALAEAGHRTRHAVDRAVERYGLTADKVAEALARLAFTDMRQVCEWTKEEIRTLSSAQIDADAHQAISEVRRSPTGELTVRLYDKRAALMDLARLKGWVAADKATDQQQVVMLKIER